jgi:IclR family acetate operon transcriptional repressor
MSSIKRSIQALDLLARKGPLGVRAVAQQLSLPLGSVHRMLVDLEDEDVVERTPDGEWELSFRLLAISGLQLDRLQFSRLAHPFAEKIAEATKETVNINALHGMAGVCIDKVRGTEAMQLDMRIGARGPLNLGGAGKAMLAYMTDADQTQVVDGPLEAYTPKSITDPKTLREELGRIRQRGYSIDDQEVVMGVWCVAVPIVDRNGRPIGALSITGPSPKKAGREVMPLVEMLHDACGTVSRRLGYNGVWPLIEAEPVAPQRRTRAKTGAAA